MQLYTSTGDASGSEVCNSWRRAGFESASDVPCACISHHPAVISRLLPVSFRGALPAPAVVLRMPITLPLSGKTDSGIGAGASRLLIDPSCLVLSSEGYSNPDGLQEPLYGVPCLLHNDGAVGTVLVSSLTCGHDVYMQDDDIPEV